MGSICREISLYGRETGSVFFKELIVKGLLSLLFFFLVFLKCGQAQLFNGGIIAGIAATDIHGLDTEGDKKVGLLFGGYINLELSHHSSIQLQLEFAQRGARLYPDSANNYSSYLMQLDYVQMPLLYRYRINNFFGLESGISYAFLVNMREQKDEYDVQNFRDSYRKDDISGHMAVQWYLNDLFTAEIEFVHSLRRIRDTRYDVGYYIQRGHFNRSLLVSVHYNFKNFLKRRVQKEAER